LDIYYWDVVSNSWDDMSSGWIMKAKQIKGGEK
jgi:hypothetical protein